MRGTEEPQEEGGATTSLESRALAPGDLAVLSHPTHIRKELCIDPRAAQAWKNTPGYLKKSHVLPSLSKLD